MGDGIERDPDLSVDRLPNKIAVGVVIAGRGGTSVSVDDDDRPGPDAAYGADDEQGRALHLNADHTRGGVGRKVRVCSSTASTEQNERPECRGGHQ